MAEQKEYTDVACSQNEIKVFCYVYGFMGLWVIIVTIFKYGV